jgi:hypothetical protein
MIALGDEKSAANAWGLYDFKRPALNLGILGAAKHRKLVYLSAERPAGEALWALRARESQGDTHRGRFAVRELCPPDLNEEEKDRLYDEGKLFLSIPGGGVGHLRPRELLPELDDPAVRERLASDPALDLELMSRAYQEGALPLEYGPRHQRWLPEWDAYVAAYKIAHPANSGV